MNRTICYDRSHKEVALDQGNFSSARISIPIEMRRCAWHEHGLTDTDPALPKYAKKPHLCSSSRDIAKLGIPNAAILNQDLNVVNRHTDAGSKTLNVQIIAEDAFVVGTRSQILSCRMYSLPHAAVRAAGILTTSDSGSCAINSCVFSCFLVSSHHFIEVRDRTL